MRGEDIENSNVVSLDFATAKENKKAGTVKILKRNQAAIGQLAYSDAISEQRRFTSNVKAHSVQPAGVKPFFASDAISSQL
ncbi:MAG: hypothetical protein COA65_00020 [Rhodospirillaceae bacterium]|nr:MAG: hypothetical protein COA65_00020 [Rhodospirillaceae bacterium]